MHRVMMAFVFACGLSSPAWSAVIEVPAPNQVMSGISYFSGWKCVQGSLTARIDGGEPFALGSFHSRGDTREVCGDVDNGWIIQFNFNRLSQGMHTFEAFDDGTSFATVEFEVVHFDEEFKTDVGGNSVITLSDGSSARVTWRENQQNVSITRICDFLASFPEPGTTYKYAIIATPDEELGTKGMCPMDPPPNLDKRLDITQHPLGATLTAHDTEDHIMYHGFTGCNGNWIIEPVGHPHIMSDPENPNCGISTGFIFGGNIGDGVEDSVVEAAIVMVRDGENCEARTRCEAFYRGTLTPVHSSEQ